MVKNYELPIKNLSLDLRKNPPQISRIYTDWFLKIRENRCKSVAKDLYNAQSAEVFLYRKKSFGR
jgi:hypothetical protein